MFERLSKFAVVISACIAVIVGAWLGARAWEPLLPLTLVALIAGAVGGRLWGARAWIPGLACAYIVPVVFLIVVGEDAPFNWMPWIAAMLGGVIGAVPKTGWSFPARWKWPLVYWTLAVALVWPVIVAREADFHWDLMSRYNLGNSGLGGPPPVVALWIVSVALTHLLGLLWFDACFALFPLSERRESLGKFMRAVIWPLGASVMLGSALAIYQGTVDISWLSDHQWPGFHRAAGGLLDGDAFGTLAGFWVGALLAVTAMARRPVLRAIAAVGVFMASAGLWMTASRMALLSGLICLAAAVWSAVFSRRWTVRQGAVVTAIGAAAIVVLSLLVARSSTANPATRLTETLPTMSSESLKKFAVNELWNRFGPFGTASMAMVRQYPLSGIGLGTFNDIFTDYAFALTGDRAHKDNAQSWYRHQLAELGVLGSAGWLLWVPMFVWLAVRTRGEGDERFPAAMVKAALFAIAVLSLVSMPTQPIAVALTVWVFAFWYLLLSAPATERLNSPTASRAWPTAGIVWIAAAIFVAANLVIGWRDLRPPFRAIRGDWTYQVGFFDLETPPGGVPFRWTEQRAVMVFPVTGEWLKLTVSGGPPDITKNPVPFEVFRRGKSILKVTRATAEPQTWYVKAPAGQQRMMLEFTVGRTWRPSSADDRELGVAVNDWTFVAAPPPGATVIH